MIIRFGVQGGCQAETRFLRFVKVADTSNLLVVLPLTLLGGRNC
jgi:hypothetical protein